MIRFRMNIDQFKRECERAKAAMKKTADLYVYYLVDDLWLNITRRTPVDRTPERDENVIKKEWGHTFGAPNPAPGQRPVKATVRAMGMHWITNPSPYGPVLEYGLYPAVGAPHPVVGQRTVWYQGHIFSTQAPGGMVRTSLIQTHINSSRLRSRAVANGGW